MNLLGRYKSIYGELKSAEQRLFECSKSRQVAEIGKFSPEVKTTDNVVRANFLKCLALMHSRNPVQGEGLSLRGAFIEGVLDLSELAIKSPICFEQCKFASDIYFRGSRFEHSVTFRKCTLESFYGERLVVDGNLAFIEVRTRGVINLVNARISAGLNFEGAQLDGVGHAALLASFADVRTGVYLSKGFSANGLVRFRSATVGGQFNCETGSFSVAEGESLDFDNAVINGSLYLRDGFSSVGIVKLLGIRILGQLSCVNGRFVANGNGHALTIERGLIRNNALLSKGFEVIGCLHLLGLAVEGNLELDGASIGEIMANELRVGGRFSLRNLKSPPNTMSMLGGRVSFLNDDLSSWGENPLINGFVYDFIDVQKSMPVGERMEWLKKQKISLKHDTSLSPAQLFRPQPWRQLQHVLVSMGRSEEAKEIGIEYEHCLRRFRLIGQTPEHWFGLWRILYAWSARRLHSCYGYLTGFGYRPMLLLPWFALVWAVCTAIYWGAASQAAIFAPSNPLVFQNETYETCRPDREQVWLNKRHDRRAADLPIDFKGSGNWYLCEALREEYTGFSPMAFSLDLLLPLVDLHQENDWAPLIATPKANALEEFKGFFSVKRLVRFVMWCEILAGWGFSLLFVAVVSGLARRKE
ncbi:membrane-associated oxidoreductase [Pseudomonas fluorescens]|jgi:hypothetical protein|uniref:Membrane-associated oxidoreductase n=1 Tax=Pseudomonas fluorescens TaxID=294 RepID=A0A5E7M7T6_PSEFL|nr:membrane-associated oxidoreductase [Pseudomonas fluorescens]VVP20953.1 hypothetical protein PS854_03800 [Pseudomonas fluorescens]